VLVVVVGESHRRQKLAKFVFQIHKLRVKHMYKYGEYLRKNNRHLCIVTCSATIDL